MKQILRVLEFLEKYIGFLMGGCWLLLGCYAGYSYCELGYPIEATRYTLAGYCLFMFVWWLICKIIDLMATWWRKKHPRTEDSTSPPQ